MLNEINRDEVETEIVSFLERALERR